MLCSVLIHQPTPNRLHEVRPSQSASQTSTLTSKLRDYGDINQVTNCNASQSDVCARNTQQTDDDDDKLSLFQTYGISFEMRGAGGAEKKDDTRRMHSTMYVAGDVVAEWSQT
ncbi:hypothetical protein RB195_012613 [Necator americanus]|uniref:Uncharacterized protein n=1 Tax=Necator americanus TaxID=51031 RepID=A0ABR1DUG1_NECAM